MTTSPQDPRPDDPRPDVEQPTAGADAPSAGAPGAGAPTQPPTGYGPRPMSPTEERNLGMIAHVVPAILLPLSAGTLGFIGSLIIYLIYKDRGPFVRQHAANSLNVQIVTAIGLIASTVLMIVLIGFLAYPLVIIIATVIHIMGAIKANNGEWWTPPLTPRLVT